MITCQMSSKIQFQYAKDNGTDIWGCLRTSEHEGTFGENAESKMSCLPKSQYSDKETVVKFKATSERWI